MTQEGVTESGRTNQEQPVVIVRGGALGDHVLTLPAVAALRRAHPRAPLGWIGHPSRAGLARPHFLADADGPAGAALYREPLGTLPEWLLGASHVILYTPAPEPLVTRLGSVCSGDVTGWDPRLPACGGLHATSHLAAAVACATTADSLLSEEAPALRSGGGIGAEASALVPHFSPTENERMRAENQWSRLGMNPCRVVLLHAGSGGDAKCWSPERFLALGQTLEKEGWDIALLTGPVEAERPGQYADLAQRWPTIGADDPVDLAALLAPVRCLIGNDSGPGHLAAAVGVTTLTLFGPTDPSVWRPRGPDSHVLQSGTGSMCDLDTQAVAAASLTLLQT